MDPTPAPPGARHRDRVALVTGAGGGIGRATALRLASEGATVVCADVDASAAGQTEAAVRATGATATAVAVDVTDAEGCRAAVAVAGDTYGGLHLLVNVAGVGGFHHTHELARAVWDRTLAVNLTGTFLMCQAALPLLLAAPGAIVNVASVAGVRATPYNAAYSASKGGVIMLTKALAVEYGGAGLRANCVCPSAVDTPFLQGFAFPEDAEMSLFARARSVLPGLGRPEEVAAAIAYLGSTEAAMVTGTALMLDGGATA